MMDMTGDDMTPHGPRLITYPFPLRRDPQLLAKITLPEDFTGREAERLAKFVLALGDMQTPDGVWSCACGWRLSVYEAADNNLVDDHFRSCQLWRGSR